MPLTVYGINSRVYLCSHTCMYVQHVVPPKDKRSSKLIFVIKFYDVAADFHIQVFVLAHFTAHNSPLNAEVQLDNRGGPPAVLGIVTECHHNSQVIIAQTVKCRVRPSR
ncbi:unnamed protein product [Ceratitis capitata]|uniref:(Mediterranean fruit fly) hypothetical protein n=1 Tax=Ceratitis capitata TaxID=7213 RepID=A0A811ULD0_CERCA|nr:unnamed protein product [Ceratitis capitata]